MYPDDPDDETILHFWALFKNDELDPIGMIDLGTMLFHRGWPNDAIDMYRQAVKADPTSSEAWFHIGLVKYFLGEMDVARHAYKKSLRLTPNHGWCHFYLALLEERTGHPSKALEHYRKAFELAPGLADATINPDLLESRIYLGAIVSETTRRQLLDRMKTSDLGTQPAPSVQIDSPTSDAPIGVQTDREIDRPHLPAIPPGARGGEDPAVIPGDFGLSMTTSPEASLIPLWPIVPDWVMALL
jgi:tetratricopeptide (TPR) repeat protein